MQNTLLSVLYGSDVFPLLLKVTFETPVGDRGALVIDDAYLWTTNGDAAASILDGDNEVLESTGALVCNDCQVKVHQLLWHYSSLWGLFASRGSGFVQ